MMHYQHVRELRKPVATRSKEIYIQVNCADDTKKKKKKFAEKKKIGDTNNSHTLGR